MKSIGRYFLSISVAATVFAGCGVLRQAQDDMQPPIAAPGAASLAVSSSSVGVLYSFKGGKFGANPEGVVEADTGSRTRELFGTTFDGGGLTCRSGSSGTSGCGTIFGVDISGKHYPFLFRYPRNGRLGASPEVGLIAEGYESFYGTTAFGGSGCAKMGCGLVFFLVPFGTSSTYNILHRFRGGTDGEEPLAIIHVTNGVYGVTWAGGGSGCGGGGCGTVYYISSAGKYSILSSFSDSGGGYNPNTLITADGELYGTTWSGGNGSGCGTYGCGTVFKLDTASGTLAVLYSFKGDKDGAGPKDLIDVAGELYGTTYYGGGSGCSGGGCGTIFEVNATTGTERVLYRFQAGQDGVGPNVLLASNAMLYGATYYGGGTSCSTGYEGCGTLFKISPSGKDYSVLYRFQGGTDGAHPTAMSESKNTFFGTTWNGGGTGCSDLGCGTIFKAKL
jgi:uncharacterized repeat protein (TIGR03803 family)